LKSYKVKGDFISRAEVVIPQKLIPWVSNALLSKVMMVDDEVPLKRIAIICENCDMLS